MPQVGAFEPKGIATFRPAPYGTSETSRETNSERLNAPAKPIGSRVRSRTPMLPTGRCLALFVSAGLRREELATLLRDQIEQRDGRWCLVDLVRKGGRLRTVAIPDWTQQAVAVWLEAMPIKEGPVLGKVNKGGRFVGAGMSALPFTAWWSDMPSGSVSSSACTI
jgi:hypothetical protein